MFIERCSVVTQVGEFKGKLRPDILNAIQSINTNLNLGYLFNWSHIFYLYFVNNGSKYSLKKDEEKQMR
jgi:hypothetical protein